MDQEPGAGESSASVPARADGTFTVTLPSNGAVIVAHRPLGVLTLRLKRLVGADYNDPMIQAMATAVLGIVSYNGEKPVITRPLEFDAFLQRFGTQDDMDFYLNAFQRFVNPEAMELVDEAVTEGLAQGLSGDALTAHVQKRSFELQRKHMEAVRD